jgi:hypothetical protein
VIVARRAVQSLRSHFTCGSAFGTCFLLKSVLILVLALVGCGGLVALTSRLATAAPNTIKAANWSGGAVFQGPGKQFDRCSAASANVNGIAITYAMDRQLRWSLAISNPEWAFTNDFSLSINLDLDDRPFRGRALVRENSSLQIEMEDQIALFATLRMAAKMRATAGGLTIELDLANSSEALSAVAQCALKQVGLGARGGNPPVKGKPARIASARDAEAQKEAAVFATVIKERAGIGGLLAAADGLPGSIAAVGWKAESAGGGVTILPASAAASVIDVRNQVLELEQRRCRGEYFFVTAVETIKQVEVVRIYVACKMPELTAITYYTAVPRSKGGAYVATSASEQGFVLILQREAETADARLRGAVVEALRRSDQQTPDIREKSAADGETTTRPER